MRSSVKLNIFQRAEQAYALAQSQTDFPCRFHSKQLLESSEADFSPSENRFIRLPCEKRRIFERLFSDVKGRKLSSPLLIIILARQLL
jgi:hypothetical protein